MHSFKPGVRILPARIRLSPCAAGCLWGWRGTFVAVVGDTFVAVVGDTFVAVVGDTRAGKRMCACLAACTRE